MTLHIFGDSWGTPWGIPSDKHFLHTWADSNSIEYKNFAKAASCISQVRDTFFNKISLINPETDSVFFVIPPDIRLYFPVRKEGIRSISVVEREWRKLLGKIELHILNRYFNSVVGSEILLLQNTCRSMGLSYTMWHNYGVIDFDSHPYYDLIDTDRFVSKSSMMSCLLGYEYSLAPGADGPDILVTNTSNYFLPRDQHPSVRGHSRLSKIYSDYYQLNTV